MLEVGILDCIGKDLPTSSQICEQILPNLMKDLNPKGLLWVACDFDPRDFVNSGPFVLANKIESISRWALLNIVICPDFTRNTRPFAFTDVCEYFLLFVGDARHRFNKDLIREEHIWQKAEWGKREKNYFPLGKDPGNVWLPTLDDGAGTVTGHAPLRIEDALARCILLAVPRKGELGEAQVMVKIRIFSARVKDSKRMSFLLTRLIQARSELFRKIEANIKRDECRNALATKLSDVSPLPFGESAFLINYNGKTFTCLHATSKNVINSIDATPDLIELWNAAISGKASELRLSKAFNLLTATNQAAKVRAIIGGMWLPLDWGVEIHAI